MSFWTNQNFIIQNKSGSNKKVSEKLNGHFGLKIQKTRTQNNLDTTKY